MCLHSDRKPPGSQAGAFVRLSVRVGGCVERPEAALRISHEGYPSLFQGLRLIADRLALRGTLWPSSYPLTVAGPTSARRASSSCTSPEETSGGAAEFRHDSDFQHLCRIR